MMITMQEAITKASHTSSFLLRDLKECYRQSNPTQEIIVRELLQRSVELEKRIQEFAGAINAEGS